MKILLIDDDCDDRALFYEAIQEVSPDTTCITEQDGQKALAALGESTYGLPDIIFVDINMPTLSGWECLDRIKHNKSTRGIPVVMFSTSFAERDLERASRSGAVCLLTKPASFQKLKSILLEIVAALHNNLPLDCLKLQVVQPEREKYYDY
jgi:CheY-like chemotaxis protein